MFINSTWRTEHYEQDIYLVLIFNHLRLPNGIMQSINAT